MSVEAPGKPPAETEISEGLIKNLIASQFPKLANLPVNIIGEGWDNVMARIDDELAARMPRHTVGEKLLKREQRWLPELAPRLPLPVPEPIHIGTPEHGYPFTWNVVRWIEGECADLSPPLSSEVETFVAFTKAVHVPAPHDAPKNSARDCPPVSYTHLTLPTTPYV